MINFLENFSSRPYNKNQKRSLSIFTYFDAFWLTDLFFKKNTTMAPYSSGMLAFYIGAMQDIYFTFQICKMSCVQFYLKKKTIFHRNKELVYIFEIQIGKKMEDMNPQRDCYSLSNVFLYIIDSKTISIKKNSV